MAAVKKQNLKIYSPDGDSNYNLQVQESKCTEFYPFALECSAPSFKLTSGSSVVDNVAVAILANAASVTSESTTRASADVALGVRIDEETTARISGDSTASTARSALQTGLNSEITRATAAEVVNADAISAEAASRASADQLLQENIDSESSARLSAVSSEADARLAADSAESTARAAADSALEVKINTEKGRIDSILALSSADLDSFKEIVTQYTNADSSLQTLITTLTATINQLRLDFDAHIN